MLHRIGSNRNNRNNNNSIYVTQSSVYIQNIHFDIIVVTNDNRTNRDNTGNFFFLKSPEFAFSERMLLL